MNINMAILSVRVSTLCCLISLVTSFSSCDIVEDLIGVEDDNSPAINIDNGLVYYTTFDDGSAKNVIENSSLNGVFVNSPNLVDDTPDGNGKAVFFNSIKGQWMTIPGDPLQGESKNFAMSFWIKNFTTGNIIAGLENETLVALSLTAESDGYFSFRTRDLTYGVYKFTGYKYAGLQNEQWHMLTVCSESSEDGLKLSLYVDGTFVDVLGRDRYWTSPLKVQVGGNNSEGSSNFYFDNLRVYNRSLTADEVKRIYDVER